MKQRLDCFVVAAAVVILVVVVVVVWKLPKL